MASPAGILVIPECTTQMSKKQPFAVYTFTVTKVEKDDEQWPSESNNSQPKQVDQFTLQVPDQAGGAHSDSESAYGDTLTQTSITKLLSRKVKTYKTYKYSADKSPVDKRRQQPGYRKRLYSRYESQDYDEIENSLFLKEQEKEKSMKVRRKWLARWIVSLLIGVGTAVVATIIEICIEYSTEYKFWALKKLVERCDGMRGSCLAIPLLCWVSINCTLVFLGSLLVTFVEPQAAGSGIPQIKCYLNGVKIPGLLTLRALLAKAVGVILSVAGGLACGKEGPMIHSGAIVAAGVSQGRSRVFNKDFKIFEYLRSDTERRDFVSGGAAAGVAAAFGAPVGGVLFSLEEGSSFWNQSLTWRIVFASMVATFTVNVFLSALHGHPSDLSNPGLISFGHFQHITYQAIEIPVFLMMAVIGGLLGALFNGINCKLTVFRRKYIVKRWVKVSEAVLVAAMSAVMAFLLIFLVDDCVPNKPDSEHESHVQMFCPEGQHNVMSNIFFKTPESSLISVLHDEHGAYSELSLGLFALLYFLLACWTYGLSVSSGVFIPSLLTGAAWGRLVGIGVNELFPRMGNNVGKYALIGAACQLGGTVRMTISLTVILIECTGDITFGLPVVMTLIIAKWVGDCFNPGLYDMHIQMMGIPLLPWEPPEMSYDITAAQVMNKPVETLNLVERVDRIVDVLENMPHLHSGFPVVEQISTPLNDSQDEDTSGADGSHPSSSSEVPQPHLHGRCCGLILRSQLVLLLKNKIFSSSPDITCELSEEQETQIRLQDFRDATRHRLSRMVEVSEEERQCFINLTRYINPTPYTVTMNTSLPRMFKLFRGLGLRHLIVVDSGNEVVGMVTRKDLARYRLNSKGVNMHVQELQIHSD